MPFKQSTVIKIAPHLLTPAKRHGPVCHAGPVSAWTLCWRLGCLTVICFQPHCTQQCVKYFNDIRIYFSNRKKNCGVGMARVITSLVIIILYEYDAIFWAGLVGERPFRSCAATPIVRLSTSRRGPPKVSCLTALRELGNTGVGNIIWRWVVECNVCENYKKSRARCVGGVRSWDGVQTLPITFTGNSKSGSSEMYCSIFM